MRKLLLIFLIMLVAGCTGMPDISGILGGSQSSKVKEQPPDVIVVQNINTLPKPPINAGDAFSVSFEVNNQEEQRDVQYVGYRLLDAGLCKLCIISEITNQPTCAQTGVSRNPEAGTFADYLNDRQVFVPKQTEFVEWTFETPAPQYLAYIDSKCPVRFMVNYTFDAISDIEVDVISPEKYSQLQQSGQFSTFVPTLTMGRGPIKINMEIGASQPLQSGKSGTAMPLYVTVQDKGTGLYSTIPKNALKITVPNDFVIVTCGDRFEYDSAARVCQNKEDIMMIDKKSPKFRLSFSTPASIPVEKVYDISANLSYTYVITNEVDVDIKAPSGV